VIITKCAEVGGICNHVEADECRNGKVLFALSKSCPDSPRKYDCCVKKEYTGYGQIVPVL
jgi:hypothetical protein